LKEEEASCSGCLILNYQANRETITIIMNIKRESYKEKLVGFIKKNVNSRNKDQEFFNVIK